MARSLRPCSLARLCVHREPALRLMGARGLAWWPGWSGSSCCLPLEALALSLRLPLHWLLVHLWCRLAVAPRRTLSSLCRPTGGPRLCCRSCRWQPCTPVVVLPCLF